MSIQPVGVIARVTHHSTLPGGRLQFFLSTRLASQTPDRLRLAALSLDDLRALMASATAAIASAQQQLARDAGMVCQQGEPAHG